MEQVGGWPTLPMVYFPPSGHLGRFPSASSLRYGFRSSSVTAAPSGLPFSRAHSFLAPSIWRRLLMQALRDSALPAAGAGDDGVVAVAFAGGVAVVGRAALVSFPF